MISDVAKRLRQAPISQWLNKNATYFNSHSVPVEKQKEIDHD